MLTSSADDLKYTHIHTTASEKVAKMKPEMNGWNGDDYQSVQKYLKLILNPGWETVTIVVLQPM